MDGRPSGRTKLGALVLLAAGLALGWWAWNGLRADPPLTSAGGRMANLVTWVGYRGFRVERGLHPEAGVEEAVLGQVLPVLGERGLQARGEGPAQAADEFSVRVLDGAAAGAGVTTSVTNAPGTTPVEVARTVFPSGGPGVAVEFRAPGGALWTGIFPADPDELRRALRVALEPLRFEPPATP